MNGGCAERFWSAFSGSARLFGKKKETEIFVNARALVELERRKQVI